MKQTIEEIVEKLSIKESTKLDIFLDGMKYQKEQDKNKYIEEDLKLAYFSAIESTGEGWNGEYAEGNNPNIEDKFSEGFKKWFKKFKKK